MVDFLFIKIAWVKTWLHNQTRFVEHGQKAIMSLAYYYNSSFFKSNRDCETYLCLFPQSIYLLYQMKSQAFLCKVKPQCRFLHRMIHFAIWGQLLYHTQLTANGFLKCF